MPMICWLEYSTVFRRVRKIAKIGYEHRHVFLAVRMEQLGSDETDFI
jgi:hypothetical protein